MKNDPRIRLIKNKGNKKILYSKSIAALNSNGEYILQLDQDDIFIREDVFQSLYYEARKNNLELVQMRDFVKKEFFFHKKTLVNLKGLHFIYPKDTHYKGQPELKDKLFSNNNNYLLWGLLIKADLYKNAIYHLWPIIMNYKIIFNEDYIITSMIAKLAKKFKYINKFILIHLIHSKSISSGCGGNKEFYLTLFFYIYYLYEYYIKENPQDIKIIINYIYTDMIGFPKAIELFPEMFNFIIKIILHSDYLLFTEKEEFLNKLNIDINKYKIFSTYEYMMKKKEFNNINNFQKSLKAIKNKINKYKANLKRKKCNISIIIYCSEIIFLRETIYSILKQIKINKEIIIVYDNNDMDNLQYIKKLVNEFEDIKLINNNKYKGLLYSYSIGILNSKGEYILSLQPGYTLTNKNILYNILKYGPFLHIFYFIKNNCLSAFFTIFSNSLKKRNNIGIKIYYSIIGP